MYNIAPNVIERRLGLPIGSTTRLDEALWCIVTGRRYDARVMGRIIAGRSLLNLFSGEYLFRTFPHRREGSLTSWRDKFLKYSLGRVGRNLDILGALPRELKSRADSRDGHILAKATELIFGAVFLEHGFKECRRVFDACGISVLQSIATEQDNPRNELRDIMEERHLPKPSYERSLQQPDSETGCVQMDCRIKGVVVAFGMSDTTESASSRAAEHALNTIEEWGARLKNNNPAQLRKRKLASDDPEVLAKKLQAFEEHLGVAFTDRGLLIQALSHRSYYYERFGPHGHNERLEFLGDAILQWIITEFLLSKYPDEINRLQRSQKMLVSNQRVSLIAAEHLSMRDVMLISKSVHQDLEQNTDAFRKIFADMFEAVLGAIYLDQGMGACRLVVDAFLHNHLTRFWNEERPGRRQNQRHSSTT